MRKLNSRLVASIDFAPLERAVMGMVGLPISLHKALTQKGRLELHSDDLLGGAGVFRTALKGTFVYGFGSLEDDWNLSVSLQIRYVTQDNGTNGISLGWAKYALREKTWSLVRRGEGRQW